jgi:hypothetical protein
MNGRRSAIVGIGAAILVGSPTFASADAGVPMLMVLWPGFWALLLPIIVLEAVVARRVLAVDWKKAFLLSAEANLVSTLAGIPVTWACLFAVEMVVGYATDLGFKWAHVPDPPAWLGYVMLPFMAPWIGPPDEGTGVWVVPAAGMWLLLFFFVVTVRLERFVVAKHFGVPQQEASRWSWQAELWPDGVPSPRFARLVRLGEVASRRTRG